MLASLFDAFYKLHSFLGYFSDAWYTAICVMREALGVAQHHDSITGTSREDVRDHYQQNISICDGTLPLMRNESHLTVKVYNALGITHSEIVTIPVPKPGVL